MTGMLKRGSRLILAPGAAGMRGRLAPPLRRLPFRSRRSQKLRGGPSARHSFLLRWLVRSLLGLGRLTAELDAALRGIGFEVRMQVTRQGFQAVIGSLCQVLRTLEQRERFSVIGAKRQRTAQRLLRAQRVAALEQHLTKVAVGRL